MAPERRPAAALGLLLFLGGALSLALAVVLNERTLSFLYADGRLVRDVVARIRTVQAGFAALGLLVGAAGCAVGALGSRIPERALSLALAACTLLYPPFLLELLLSFRRPGFYEIWDPFGLCRTSIAVSHPRLGHVLNPELDHSYRINRWGFRGPDFPERKTPGEVRIVTLGDSITFGWELSEHARTYPGQLQELLDRLEGSGRRLRVINAGVPRYTSEQALRLLRERLLDLDPDLIVLCIGWNDLAFSYHRDWRPKVSFRGRSRSLHCRSFSPAIVRSIRSWKGRLEDLEEEDEGGERPERDRAPHPGALAEYRANLKEIASLLEERGVSLLLLNLPSVLSRGPMSEEERDLARRFPEVDNLALFEDVIRDVCRVSGVPCALDVFSLQETGKAAYFYDHCHPNREGNAVLARKVFEAISSHPRLVGLLGLPRGAGPPM